MRSRPLAPLDAEASRCLDAILDSASWLHRRKHSVELLEPERVRNTTSVDFSPPKPPILRAGTVAPLFFLRKAPGSYFLFDLRDAAGHAKSLPSRTENASWSARVLREFAFRILGPEFFANKDQRREVTSELRYIAHAESEPAIGRLLSDWIVTPASPQPAHVHDVQLTERVSEGWRGELAQYEDFWALLTALADSSVCVITIDSDQERQVVKLAYDSLLAVVPRSRWQRLERSVAVPSGLRALRTHLVVPWVRARTFHFELHAPAGMRVVGSTGSKQLPVTRRTRSSKKPTVARRTRPVHGRHDHLYDDDARQGTRFVGAVWYRANAAALGIPALIAASIVTGVCVAIAVQAPWVHSHPQAAISAILLTVPGTVVALLSRPTHAVTVRLLTGVRIALSTVALVAYIGAGRLALSTRASPASTSTIEWWFWILAGVSGLATLGLLVVKCASWYESWNTPRRAAGVA